MPNNDQDVLDLITAPATREQGYRLLVQTYHQNLYWQVRKLVITHDDAHDVVQNVFIKVYKGIKNFKGDSKLSSWLYRIAYNESMTHLKVKARMKQVSSQELLVHLTERLEADVYFEGDAIQLALQKALATLPDRQREIFNYRYFDDLKFREIAAVLDLSEGAVKSSYHIAAKKVEQHLKDH